MSDRDDDGGERGQLRYEAASWFARLRGPDADAHRAAFEAWLARGALHRAAYNRVAEVFAAGKLLKQHSGIVDRRRPALWSALALALLGAGLAMFGVGPAGIRSGNTQKVLAGKVEGTGAGLRRVALADGSHVTLDADTVLSLRFDERTREVKLERGRARFVVRHERRPFSVVAGAIRIVARGTVFDVGLSGRGTVDVKLFRGKVEVEPEQDLGRSIRPVVLRPGQQVASVDGAMVAQPIPIEDHSDWAGPLRVFDRITLEELVRRASQEVPERIEIADPSLRALTVSGAFRISDGEALARQMGQLFDLTVERRENGVLELRRRNRKISTNP